MLLNNQRITLDFASKTPVKINNIMYKEGEKDRDGIIIEGLNVSIQETDSVVVYWLYSTQDLYIFVPTLGERISETEIKTLPPRGVLQKGEVGVEAIVLGADGSELKSQSGYIPVQASLIQEDYGGDADDDVSITMQLIAQATDLHQAAIALNAQMATAHQGRIDAENLREDKFDVHEANLIQKRDGVASATSATNTAKDGANTAKANADSKASLANSKATLAQTAATNANNAKTAADASAASANTVKSQLDSSTSSANTAKANADSKASLADTKATLANDKATLANTAAINADNARNKAVAIPGEIVKARTGMDGAVHANLNERLRKDFEFIGKKLPVSKTSSGNGEVVFDGSLSGDVSGVVATGQTLVNVAPVLSYPHTAPQNATGTTSNAGMHDITKTYTVMCDFEINEDNVNGQVLRFTYANNFTEVMLDRTDMIKQRTLKIVKVPPQNKGAFRRYQIGYVRQNVGNTSTARITIHKLLILEGDHTDKPLEFFEGLKSAELSEVTSHGVNLVDNSKFTQGVWYTDGAFDPTLTTYRTFNYKIKAKPNTTYKFIGSGNDYSGNMYFWSDENTIISPIDTFVFHTFTTPSNTKYITPIFSHNSITNPNFSIYEVAPNTPTTYVPYQSSKTTPEAPVVLRSLPNGVADTYDFDTQTLTRRCGEVVLNGTESFREITEWGRLENTLVFEISHRNDGSFLLNQDNILSDKFLNVKRSVPIDFKFYDYEGMALVGSGSMFAIRIAKSKLATPDVAGFKAWLQANPTTVVYQLATPTTEKIDASGQLRSYDYQTTIRTDSVVPPKITATAPIDFTTSLTTIANGISTVSNNDNAEYLSTEMSNIHDELNAIKAILVTTPEA